MARFYGSIQGQRGEATRLGSKASGVTVTAASWAGAIRSRVYVRDDIGSREWLHGLYYYRD